MNESTSLAILSICNTLAEIAGNLESHSENVKLNSISENLTADANTLLDICDQLREISISVQRDRISVIKNAYSLVQIIDNIVSPLSHRKE